MKATKLLNNLGQSLWLDYITRDMLNSGALKTYIDDLSITGLSSDLTNFETAIRNSNGYDEDIQKKLNGKKHVEELFFEMALEDLKRAADLFRPIYDKSNGMNGWVSLEISPLLARDTDRTLAAARDLFARADRPNLFIAIPGTKQGLLAIEEAIFAGVPVNVTHLFSREQYLAASEAFLRGIERRIDAGFTPNVGSVASVCVNRWDTAVRDHVPFALRNRLGIAMAKRIYKTARCLLSSARWQRIYYAGGLPQRLVWASTADTHPQSSDIVYVKALAAPLTIVSMSEKTLKILAGRDKLTSIMAADGGSCESVLGEFAEAGIDIDSLALQLQDESVRTLVKSWNALMAVIGS